MNRRRNRKGEKRLGVYRATFFFSSDIPMKGRHWKLANLAQNVVESNTKTELFQAERDRAEFLNELEEDPEFRSTINLIAEPNAEEILAANRVKSMATGSDDEDDDDDEDDFPEVEMSELIQATAQISLGGPQALEGDDDDDDED